MFKKLFQITISLIVKPSDAWRSLSEKKEEEHDKFLSDYVYPFIGLITVAAFVGVFFSLKEFDFQLALKKSIIACVSAFGGFFSASYLTNELLHHFFKRNNDMKTSQLFIGYASSLMFSLNIVLYLLPEFFFLKLLILYTVFIIWEGTDTFFNIEPADRMKFTAYVSLFIIISPVVIELVVGMLMPGLRV